MSDYDEENLAVIKKSFCKKIFEWFSLINIVGFSIFSQIAFEKNFLYPWVSFVVQVPLTILMSVLTYNFLDFIYPPILFKDNDYKNHRITKIDKIKIFLCYFFFILIIFFLLFISVLYVLNFGNASGIYYLQLIQSSLFFSTIFYFLIDAVEDFSGHAYCDYIRTTNQYEKIKKHWLPRTLDKEVLKLYYSESFSGF